GDGGARLAGLEGGAAADVLVVGVRRRRHVGGVVRQGHRRAGGGRQGEVEHHGRAAGVALDHRRVADGDRRQGVVIGDRAGGLRAAEGGSGRVGQVQVERLVRLVGGVAVDQDGDRLRRDAGVEGQRAGGRLVVAAGGGGGPVGGGVVDRDRRGLGLVEADGEGERLGAALALGGQDVGDGDRRGLGVVVVDVAQAEGVVDGGVGRVVQVDGEGLVRLVQGVAVDQDGERLGGLARAEGQGAGGVLVVAAGGGGGAVLCVVTDGHRLGAGLRQGDGERHRRGAAVALGHGRGGVDGDGRQ